MFFVPLITSVFLMNSDMQIFVSLLCFVCIWLCVVITEPGIVKCLIDLVNLDTLPVYIISIMNVCKTKLNSIAFSFIK